MPNRWPITSGSWSNAAIWSGSLIPTAADDVFLNNQLVILDQDISVLTIRNSTSASAIIGGGILSVTGSYNITASNGLNSSGVATANGMIQFVGSGTLNISGSILANGIYTIGNLSTGTVTLVGDVLSNSLGNGIYSIDNQSTGTIIVTGSVYGGALNYNAKYGIRNNSGGTVLVRGDVYGGRGGNAANGIANLSSGLVIIDGTVRAGTTSSDGGALGFMYGVVNSGNGTVIINGAISASLIAPGVGSTGTAATLVCTGPFFNTGSQNAVFAYRIQLKDSIVSSWRFDTEISGSSKTIYTSNQLPGVPRQTDVRQGTQYNFGLTGSLNIPDPTTVRNGVAVDNTTGSAILSAHDMFNILTQDIVQTGSIGETLKNASTVQTTAATISSFKV
jgi:hypothetical protein